VSVVHDNPPVIVWTEPVEFSVALPTVPLDVRCVDDMPGCALVVVDEYGTLREGGSPLTGILDLTAGLGRRDVVQVTARDRSGQATRAKRTLYPESPDRLELLVEVPGVILDTDGRRVLSRSQSASGDALSIFDRDTGSTVDIVLPSGWALSDGAPTPELVSGGVVFNASTAIGDSREFRAYFWKPDLLTQVGADGSRFGWVADPYALYTSAGELRLLDTGTGSSRTIATPSGFDIGASVAPDGTVAYSTGREIVRDDDGVQSIVARDELDWLQSPLVDGDKVVYFSESPAVTGVEPREIRLVERGVETVLSGGRTYDVPPPAHYQVGQGWVAYTDTGEAGIVHVYMRDPAGMTSRRTDLGVSTAIETLGTGGEIMVVSPQDHRRYYTRGSTPFPVSSVEGRSYHLDGQWYVSIGRALLRVDTRE
jgi:hypothetical protein